MPRLFPKARLIIIHDHPGRNNPIKCNLTERMISGLGLTGRVVVHDFHRFLDHLNAIISKYADMVAFVEHRSGCFPSIALTDEQQSLLLKTYCAYFTDLKIWLDENPKGIIVVRGCSFLEETVYRSTNPNNPSTTADQQLQVFLTHFRKLFADIPTLSILVDDISNISKDDVRLKAYQDAVTYWSVVNNTDDDYFQLAVKYDLFDLGQHNSV